MGCLSPGRTSRGTDARCSSMGTLPQASLLKLLADWRREVGEDTRASRRLRMTVALRGTPLTAAVSVLVGLMALLDAPSPAGGVKMNALRELLALFSCLPAQYFFMRRLPRARRVLEHLICAASVLEVTAPPSAQAVMSRTASRGRQVARCCAAYALLTAVVNLCVLMPDDGGTRVVEQLPSPLRLAALVAAKMAVAVAVASCLVAFYTCYALLLVAYTAAAALLSAVEDCARRPAGPRNLRAVCWAHSKVLMGVSMADAMFRDLYPLYMFVILSLPLVDTALFVSKGEADLITPATIPAVLAVFVPICLSGQRVQDTSTAACWGFYCGPWPEEGRQPRQLRAQAMAAATKVQCITMHGFGPLDRAACVRAASTWFRFLQILLSLQ